MGDDESEIDTPTPGPGGRPFRIVMMNDELDLLYLCQVVLEEQGYEVAIATGGGPGVAMARRWRPDLLVIDWVMPDMDGNAVMTTLRSTTETRRIPVLMMSALRDGAVRARLAGARRFLPKPFTDEELIRAVRATLEAPATEEA